MLLTVNLSLLYHTCELYHYSQRENSVSHVRPRQGKVHRLPSLFRTGMVGVGYFIIE